MGRGRARGAEGSRGAGLTDGGGAGLPGRGRARLALVLTTLLWGISFVLVQRAIRTVPVFHLLGGRFLIALLVLLPFALRAAGGAGIRRGFRPIGLAVGGCLFVGFILQTYGLYWTTPARSAFLTGLAVLFVPLATWLMRAGLPNLTQTLGTLLAASGLGVLLGPQNGSSPFNRGDLLTLLGAVVFAFHLTLISRALPVTGVLPLAISQFTVMTVLAAPSFALQPVTAAELAPASLVAVLTVAIVCTVFAFSLQLYGQQRLSAIETGLLLTLEPVFATAFSVGIGEEPFTSGLLWGGLLILGGTLVAQWPSGRRGRREKAAAGTLPPVQ
jgi:drug/metabolite transporter (DMT)-like permease